MIEEDRRRRKRGGIFGEDFVERDRLRLVGIVTQLRCEMSGYEAELLGMDRGCCLLGWNLFKVWGKGMS